MVFYVKSNILSFIGNGNLRDFFEEMRDEWQNKNNNSTTHQSSYLLKIFFTKIFKPWSRYCNTNGPHLLWHFPSSRVLFLIWVHSVFLPLHSGAARISVRGVGLVEGREGGGAPGRHKILKISKKFLWKLKKGLF